jgi:DNA-binding NarL/FixJ family response regulator
MRSISFNPNIEATRASGNGRRVVSRLRIALVDSDERIYAAVRDMVNGENWEIEWYPDGREAFECISRALPDVVVMDIAMPGFCGIDCAYKLRRHMPDLPVVMLTACADPQSIMASLMAGATGYLLKPASSEGLKEVIVRVTHGHSGLCDEAQVVLATSFSRPFASFQAKPFSGRQLQIMGCLIQTLTNKEISVRLGMTTNTVHVHLVQLFRKLRVHNRDEAVQKIFSLCIGIPCDNRRFPNDGEGRQVSMEYAI